MNRKVITNNKVVQLEILISRLLQIGVGISAFTILTGIILFLVTGNSGYPGDAYPSSELEILKGFLEFKPYAIILYGLLLLILTPVFRVAITIYAFYQERDYLYVLITIIVSTILLTGFLLGKVL